MHLLYMLHIEAFVPIHSVLQLFMSDLSKFWIQIAGPKWKPFWTKACCTTPTKQVWLGNWPIWAWFFKLSNYWKGVVLFFWLLIFQIRMNPFDTLFYEAMLIFGLWRQLIFQLNIISRILCLFSCSSKECLWLLVVFEDNIISETGFVFEACLWLA